MIATLELRELRPPEYLQFPGLERAPVGPGPSIAEGGRLLILADAAGVYVYDLAVGAGEGWWWCQVSGRTPAIRQAVAHEVADTIQEGWGPQEFLVRGFERLAPGAAPTRVGAHCAHPYCSTRAAIAG